MGDNGKRTTHGKRWYAIKNKCHCPECRMAIADYMVSWRKKRRAAGLPYDNRGIKMAVLREELRE